MSYFTSAENYTVTALHFGVSVVCEIKVWDVCKVEKTLFGEHEVDDWLSNKLFFPKFLELKTKKAFMEDLVAVYVLVVSVCERAMMELPAQYTFKLPRKRKLQLMKFHDFVDNFYSVNNDMQELHSMCKLLSTYVDCVLLAENKLGEGQ